MSDNRRKAEPKETRVLITKILNENPLRSGELRIELHARGGHKYSRDRFNDILNQMIVEGTIRKTVLPGKPYPVYEVVKDSRLMAELEGLAINRILTDNLFEELVFKPNIDGLSEAESNKFVIDQLIRAIGFYVVGTTVMSFEKTPKERRAWLRPILNLENSNFTTVGFYGLFTHAPNDPFFLPNAGTQFQEVIKILKKHYPKEWEILKGSLVKARSEFEQVRQTETPKAIDEHLTRFYHATDEEDYR